MGITFNYIPDSDVRKRAVEWFEYGLHPSESQNIAELGRSVDDAVRDLARAKAERGCGPQTSVIVWLGYVI